MERQPAWSRIRALLIAQVLAIGVLALCQFAATAVRLPGACLAPLPPGDRMLWWLRSGMEAPLSDVLDDEEVLRLGTLLGTVAVLAVLLGLSIASMRPIRIGRRLRLRTLMILVAVVPLEWAAGSAAWGEWVLLGHLREWQPIYDLIEDPPIIQADDILLVEVLEALPDRPITGERRAHPDGSIDLGYYGKVEVVGLTTREARGRIVTHLRRFLDDEQLGLTQSSGADPATASGVDPADSDRIFVDHWSRPAGDGTKP